MQKQIQIQINEKETKGEARLLFAIKAPQIASKYKGTYLDKDLLEAVAELEGKPTKYEHDYIMDSNSGCLEEIIALCKVLGIKGKVIAYSYSDSADEPEKEETSLL